MDVGGPNLKAAVFLKARASAWKAKAQASVGEAAPNPLDSSVFGVTNVAIHASRANERVVSLILEYIMGYCSSFDPQDLDAIEYARGGRVVGRGRSLKDIALKYAQILDKQLGEAPKRGLKTMIRRASTGFVQAEKNDDMKAWRDQDLPTSQETFALSRNTFLQESFPDRPWPKPTTKQLAIAKVR